LSFTRDFDLFNDASRRKREAFVFVRTGFRSNMVRTKRLRRLLPEIEAESGTVTISQKEHSDGRKRSNEDRFKTWH
jgi:hypothetical protein